MIDKVVNNGHTSNSGNGNIVPIITNNNNVNKIIGRTETYKTYLKYTNVT